MTNTQKYPVMLLSNFIHIYIVGLFSINSYITQPSSVGTIIPTLICPASSNTVCTNLPAPFSTFESFEDEGGSAIGGTFTESSFVLVSSSNPSVCILNRTYQISDSNGNRPTCTQVINITGDVSAPLARCKPLVVKLGGTTGQYSVDPAVDLNNGSTDDCGIQRYATDKPLVGCNDIGTTINYTLTVTDNCGKTNTCTSTITTNSCPQDTTKALNVDCSITVPDYRTRIRTFMPCQRPVTNVAQTPSPGTILLNSSHNRRHTINFIITNGVGLTESCSFDLIAIDTTRPVLICKSGTLTVLSETALRPDTLFSASADNCNVLTYDIRRVGNNCETGLADDFGPYASFCCTDVNRAVAVAVRATDQNGNTATCSRNVRVLDGAPPVIRAGSLPDITISCQYPLNLGNLNAFGTIGSSTSVPSTFVINDPGNPTVITYQNGVFTNCDGGAVTSTSRNTLNSCAQGRIFRDFVVTDLSGNRATYTQTITVRDASPFSASDIVWPAKNVNFDACNNVTPSPTVTGRPTITNDKCSRADATYKDQKFTVGVCGFIIRTWTVIDWCTYQTNNPASPGVFTYSQNINYINKIAPTLTGRTCRDTIFCVGANCTAIVGLIATGTDDCIPVSLSWAYKFDLGNNNTTDASGSNNSFSGTLAPGVHSITWTARDKCNNSKSCKSLITVKDCTAPSMIARNGLAANINPSFGNVTLWGNDFVISGSDNCTPSAQIRYSFSTNVNNTSRIYTCNNRGNNTVDIWATDLVGNQSKVTTVINIQDNNKYCGNFNDPIEQRVVKISENAESHFVSNPSPNPYNEAVKIDVLVTEATDIQWIVWDVEGKIVGSKNQRLNTGLHTVILDDNNQKLQAGTYFYKIAIDKEEKAFRVIKL